MRPILLLLALVFLTSCSTRNHSYWKKYHLAENPPGASSAVITIGGHYSRESTPEANKRIELEAGDIAKLSAWRVTSGMTSLSMPAGARQGSKQFVRWLDTAERETSKELGVERLLRLHYIGVQVPKNVSSLEFSTTIDEPNTLPFVTPLWDGEKRPTNLDPAAIFIGLHELYEFQLVSQESAPTALPDALFRTGLVKRKIRAHTRWFRDGFATYAAMIATGKLTKLSQGQWPPKDKAESLNPFESPLRDLSQVGTRLFAWDQFSAGRYNAKNYPASYGLFLLLEQRYGRAGIRRWIEAIKRQEIPDRAGILRAAQEAFGTDLRSIVKNYRYEEA